MATTSTSNVGSNALGVLFDRKVIQSLQPNLYFESLATVVMVGEGAGTDRFVLFNQISTAAVTTLTEGTAPTATGVTVTVNDITPTQYGISVQVTDLVVLTTFFDLLVSTSVEVGFAMARKIDSVIQTVATGGTNVYYAGGKASRATLGAGDLLDYSLLVKGGQKLRNGAAPTFADGYYRAVLTPSQVFDLKSNTSAGQWIDVSKYAQPETILNGEIGAINGTRIMQSPNVQTFASTVTVAPAVISGFNAFRVAYWLPGRVKNYLNHPEASSIANPIGQLGNVGAKTNMGAAQTQDARLVRIETAQTTL